MTECGEDDVGPGASDRRLTRGLTLVEVLVTVGIILVLFTLMVVSTRAIQASARQSRAAAQVRLIAEAVEAYAEAWTVWRLSAGQPVADRAWPHWSAWAQFPSPPYVFPPPSPNCPMVNAPWQNVADDDATDAVGLPTGRQDVESSAACLAYALLTPAMGKTLMPEAESAFPIKDGCAYPALAPATTASPLRLVLDAWGAPVRYFWVARDADSYSGWRMITSADPNDAQSPAIGPPDPFFAVAQGFVLESAGPDGRFGNVWKRGPSQSEVDAAADNVTVRP